MTKILYILLFCPFVAFGQLTPCEQDVENAIGLIGEYVPQCEEDGSYSPMQCWSSTGYCWCVDENGVEIPGTSIQSWLGTPDCSNNQETCVAIPIENCIYFDIWAPVCGCDNVTYSNMGEAACNSIFEFTTGECGTSTDIYGCTDNTAINYNPIATIDDGSCIYIIYGCLDPFACNFNSEANIDDGSCIYAEMYYDCSGNCINDIDLDGECDEVDYDDGVGLDELGGNTSKLIKLIDVLGIEQKEHVRGKLLFYLYDNGKIEKRIKF